MLSILIPVYNYDVRALVKALADQMERLDAPAEVVIRDDGSELWLEENKTLSELPGVRYSSNETNLGRSATRQALAQEASFEYLLFLDADVLPVNNDFLKVYLEQVGSDATIACGGVKYRETLPDSGQMLRYVYGSKRESQPAVVRQKTPYMVLAANICITRSRFLKLNDQLENFYGDDLVLSQKILGVEFHSIEFDVAAHLGTLASVFTIYRKVITKAIKDSLSLPMQFMDEKRTLFRAVFFASVPR